MLVLFGVFNLYSVAILYISILSHHEVELLCLLLVGPSLGNAGFAEVRF